MAVSLYMDHHVPRSITVGLRLREVAVITAHEDDASQMSDSDLLNRASELARAFHARRRSSRRGSQAAKEQCLL